MSMTIKTRKFGKKVESKVCEMTFRQGLDDFLSVAPEGGWSDYWAMQQDWEFYKDNLCRDRVITQKQADSWSNPCTPDTFDRWQKRNGLTHRGGYESKKSEALTKQQILVRASKNPKIDDLLSAMGSEWVKVLPVDSNSITKRSTGERLHSNKFSNADTQTTLEIAWTDDGIVEWARNTATYEEPMTESKKPEASSVGKKMENVVPIDKAEVQREFISLLPDDIACGYTHTYDGPTVFMSLNPDKYPNDERTVVMYVQGYDATNPALVTRIYNDESDKKGHWGKMFEFNYNPENPWKQCADYVSSLLLGGTTESKKSEASKFGAGMVTIKDKSKLRNFGEILDVLEEHRKHLKAKSEDLKQSKEDLEASIKKLNEFSKNVDMLKQQSVKGIKDAITFNKSPEVKAAADIEKALKDTLKVVYSDYTNVPDVMQLLTVLDSRYATRGDKVVTTWIDNANRAIEVDAQTIKDSIADGLMDSDDVVQLVTVTKATYGVKDKFAQEKLGPVLERMNTMLLSAPKLEEAVIDPQQFKDLRDLIEKIVDEASTPTQTIKTSVTTLSKGDIASLPKAGESLVSEGLLDKLKEIVSALKDKISALWDSFTSLFFDVEDEALESADTFSEVEEAFAVVGIVVESYMAKKHVNLGKKFEVLTKAVLTCCDDLVKDSALAGEFDDEVIYTEDAVKNAVESFKQLGEACTTLKNALSYHKNEDNMNVIGILADAITQIVNDEEGDTEGESESEEDEESVIDQVEREYAPEDEEETVIGGEPSAVGVEEPEEF